MICTYCRAVVPEKNRTVDHRIPLSRGGTNSKHNLVMACKECNAAKGNKLELEFIQWLRAKRFAS